MKIHLGFGTYVEVQKEHLYLTTESSEGVTNKVILNNYQVKKLQEYIQQQCQSM